MGEELRLQVLRAQVEYDDNVGPVLQRFNEFNSAISTNLSRLGQYKTEVTDFKSAMTLAFEAPKRSMRDFFSLWRVGADQIKQGGPAVATGLSGIFLALRNIAERVPGLKGVANGFSFIARAAKTASTHFSNLRLRAQGLDGDFKVLIRSMSDVADTMRTQVEALRMQHAQELRTARGLIAEQRAKIKLWKAEGRAIEDIRQEQLKLTNMRLEYLKMSDEHKVQAGILRNVQLHANQANQAMRRLNNTIMTGAGDGKKQIADMERSLRNMRQEMGRAEKAGLDIRGVTASYDELSIQLGVAKQKAEELRQSKEKLSRTTKKVGASVKTTTTYMQGMSSSFMMVSSSLSTISPQLSSIVMTVNRFGGAFVRQMTMAGNTAEEMAMKVQAGMMLVKGSLIAAGIAAAAFIKKTGLLASEVTTLEITMRQVARNVALKAGADVQKFVAYVDQIPESLKGITTREALQATTSFLRGVPQLLPRIQELAKAAKDFGVTVADMSSSEVFGRFNTFIQSGNTALLKRLNIVTTANQMHERWADRNDVVAKSMTAQQKIMARFEGIMEEVAMTSGVYEEAMQSAGKQLSSMSRLTEEAALVMGTRFEPMIAKIIFGVNKLLTWFVELPPAVHDVLGAIVQATAIFGALVGLVTVAGPALRLLVPAIKMVGKAIATSLPQLLAIGAAIGVVILAVKLFRRAWEENFGGIRDAIQTFVGIFKVAIEPLMAQFRRFQSLFGEIFGDLSEILVTLLIPAFEWLARVVYRVTGIMVRAMQTIQDVSVGSIGVVAELLMGLRSLLSDNGEAAQHFEDALVTALTVIAYTFQKTIAKAAVWGWNLIVTFANNIYKGAQAVLVQVMKWVGNLISRFWSGRSPPKEGPLRYIEKWAKGVMETYLRAFGLADFGILRDVMAPIQQALQDAVRAGTLREADMIPTLRNVRTQMAELIKDFRETGQINEEIFTSISDALGEGSEDLTEYIRRVLEHQSAMENLKRVQEEVAQAQKTGFVPADLRKQLEAAEEEAEKTKEAVSWQREFIAATRETVDMQLRQLELLERMAEAMEKVAGVGKGEEGVTPEEPLKLEFPEIEEIDTESARESIGGLSQEFLDMRDKVQKAYDAFKAWLDLPWDEKLSTIVSWFSDLTGIDWQPLIDGIAELDLQKISDWIEDVTGFNPLQWAQDTFGTAWDWIVEKTTWLYNQLIGESLIPDLVSGINDEFAKITAFSWFQEKFDRFYEWWTEVSELLKKSFSDFVEVWGGPLADFLSRFNVIKEIFTGIEESTAMDRVTPVDQPGIGFTMGEVEPTSELMDSLGELGRSLAGLRDAFAELWEALLPVRNILATVFVSVLAVLGATLAGIVDTISILVRTVIDIAPKIINVFSSVVRYVTGLMKLGSALLTLLFGDPEEAKRLFDEGVALILGGMEDFVTSLIDLAGTIAIAIAEAAGQLFITFADTIANLVIDVLENFGIIDEETAEIWRRFVGEITGNLQEALDNVIEQFTMWKDDAIETFNALVDLAKEIWNGLFGEDGYIMAKLKEWAPFVIGVILGVAEDLGEAWDGIKKKAEEIWSDLFGEDGSIRTWVENAVDDVIRFVTGLWEALVGRSLFQDIRDDIAGIWDEIFGEEGFIRTQIADAIQAIIDFGQEIWDAGAGLINSLFAGIKSAWEAGGEVLGKAWSWFKDQLPGSEPKDPNSPFANLETKGAAVMEGLLRGMASVDVSGAVMAQLAGMVGGMAQSSTSIQNNRNYMFQEGAFTGAFPNVTGAEDGAGFLTQLDKKVEKNRAFSWIGGSG